MQDTQYSLSNDAFFPLSLAVGLRCGQAAIIGRFSLELEESLLDILTEGARKNSRERGPPRYPQP